MTKPDKRPNIEWTVACKKVTFVSLSDDRGRESIHVEAYDDGSIQLTPEEARELLLGALLHLGTGKSKDIDSTTGAALELCHLHMMARERSEKEMRELHQQIATLNLQLGEVRGALNKQ